MKRLPVRFLFGLGLVSAVVLMIPYIVLFGAFAGGLPGIVLGLAPAVLTIVLPAVVLSMLVPRVHWLLMVCPVLGALWFASEYFNRHILAGRDAWLARDVTPDQTRPGRHLGIFGPHLTPPGRASTCTDLCMTLLLSEQVDSVIFGELSHEAGSELAPKKLFGFRLARQEVCPSVNVVNSAAGEAMRLAMAGGVCLIGAPAQLSDVTSATFQYWAKRADKSQYEVGWDLWADTISAHRLDYYERQDGSLELKFRTTSVRYEPFFPILIPGFNGGPELRIGSGFMRWPKKTDAVPFEQLMTATLGFDLELDANVQRQDQRQALRDALADADATAQDARFHVAEDYFRSFRKAETFSAEDAELVLGLMSDRRFVSYAELSNVTSTLARARPDDAAKLGDLVLARFKEATPETRTLPTRGVALFRLKDAVMPLPDTFFASRTGVLTNFANDAIRRPYAGNLLARLGAGGSEVIPVLLGLVDEMRAGNKPGVDGERRRSLYFAGLEGLCRMGARASGALPQLMQRLQAGSLLVRKYGSDNETLIRTLIALGGDAVAFWPYFQRAEMQKKQFDHIVGRAKERRRCG